MCNCRQANRQTLRSVFGAMVDLLEMTEAGIEGRMAALEARMDALDGGEPPSYASVIEDTAAPVDATATETTVFPTNAKPGDPIEYGQVRSWDIKLDHRTRLWEIEFDFVYDSTAIEKEDRKETVMSVGVSQGPTGHPLAQLCAERNALYVNLPMHASVLDLPVSILPGVSYHVRLEVDHGAHGGVFLRVTGPTTSYTTAAGGFDQMLLPPVGDVTVEAAAGDQFVITNLRIDSRAR